MADRVETPEQLVRRLMKDAGISEPVQRAAAHDSLAGLAGAANNTRLHGWGVNQVWWDEVSGLKQHQIDTAAYLAKQQEIAQARAHRTAVVREKTLSDFSNADLVMEMLSRGFAVMKLPEDGGAPEVLR